MESFPIIENITLSFLNVSNEIYPLIKSIRPDWTLSNTRLVTFTEGLTNTILGLFDIRTPADDSNALVIKIYGLQTELFIDRQAEIKAMTKFYEHGVFPQRVLIQFTNGVIYEYASGQTCTRDNVRDEHISRLVAIKLAQLHNVTIDEVKKPYIMLLLRRFIKLLNVNNFDLTSIISDVDMIEEQILPRLIPDPKIGIDLVLCHNDLLVKNIVYNEKDQTVSFIDFEYTHVNYALFDVANHFVEYAGVENADFDIYPSRDEQKRWLKFYFQTRAIHEQVIDDKLCLVVDQFSALSNLMWGLWALVQAKVSNLDFDYVNYANKRLDRYRKLRKLLFENE
ncbi:hypothetical protein I4U23_023576 [Adineta vaga]|nr:hypothetical protein I4U23_023576 [Adineta vaga]